MNYAVVWLDTALGTIWDFWNDTPSEQNAIMFASQTLQMHLEDDPMNMGESRASLHDRIAIEKPLQILYRVYENEKLVVVSRVNPFGRTAS